MTITQSQLRSIFDYNEETGYFVWKDNRGNNLVKGKRAGCYSHGYRKIVINGTQYLEHRLVWLYVNGFWPSQIDHVNGVRSDNRLINLRMADQAENTRNRCVSKNNKSGVMGVNWHKRLGKWRAFIEFQGVQHHLGVYDHLFDAVCARKSAERKYGFHINHGKTLDT